MVDPIVALAVFAGIVAALAMMLWPRRGLFVRLNRLIRMTERVRIEDALKHLHDQEYPGKPSSIAGLAGTLEMSRRRARLRIWAEIIGVSFRFRASRLRLDCGLRAGMYSPNKEPTYLVLPDDPCNLDFTHPPQFLPHPRRLPQVPPLVGSKQSKALAEAHAHQTGQG